MKEFNDFKTSIDFMKLTILIKLFILSTLRNLEIRTSRSNVVDLIGFIEFTEFLINLTDSINPNVSIPEFFLQYMKQIEQI